MEVYGFLKAMPKIRKNKNIETIVKDQDSTIDS